MSAASSSAETGLHGRPRAESNFSALIEALDDERLTFSDVRVYAAMLSERRKSSRDAVITCRPSRKRLAKRARLNPITVSRNTQRLTDRGYIAVQKSKGRNTNIYTLLRLAGISREIGREEPLNFPTG